MRPLYKGLILALIHILLVSSLGGKLLIDRSRLPRIWIPTAPVDPELPIRGRYIRLLVEADASRLAVKVATSAKTWVHVNFQAENGKLLALPATASDGVAAYLTGSGAAARIQTVDPMACFIPEHVPDPSRRAPDEELWVEVTVPHKGPPRPIRIGVKKAGVLTPLELN
ncbi:MAG: hypothetical protein HYR55_02070 [Acidobacteria bacterium]|nr:hypothetical protein [Acidobacteriota bacterium]MBI3658581.1 hypothetical protein [Acidobacteriota bacterium]